MSVALFGRATSPTNVLFSQGTLDAQIIFDISVKFEALINEASFDILPVFTNTEVNKTLRLGSNYANLHRSLIQAM